MAENPPKWLKIHQFGVFWPKQWFPCLAKLATSRPVSVCHLAHVDFGTRIYTSEVRNSLGVEGQGGGNPRTGTCMATRVMRVFGTVPGTGTVPPGTRDPPRAGWVHRTPTPRKTGHQATWRKVACSADGVWDGPRDHLKNTKLVHFHIWPGSGVFTKVPKCAKFAKFSTFCAVLTVLAKRYNN